MMVSIKGTFQNGVVQPSEPIADREGQTVIITFVEERAEKNAETINPDTSNTAQAASWDRLMQSIERNTMDTGIEDLAHQHDHYLHGKQKHEQ